MSDQATPLHVDDRPDEPVVILRDDDGVTTAIVLIDPRNPAASVALAHRMAAAELLFGAVQALSDGHDDPCWCPWTRREDGDHTRPCEMARAALAAAMAPRAAE